MHQSGEFANAKRSLRRNSGISIPGLCQRFDAEAFRFVLCANRSQAHPEFAWQFGDRENPSMESYVLTVFRHLHWRFYLLSHSTFHCVGLLSYLFELFERSEMPKLSLLECFPLLIKCGKQYTHLASDLHQYLPNVVKIVRQQHQIKAQHQVVMTVFEFAGNVSLSDCFDFHFPLLLSFILFAHSWPQTIEFPFANSPKTF